MTECFESPGNLLLRIVAERVFADDVIKVIGPVIRSTEGLHLKQTLVEKKKLLMNHS